MGGGGGGGVLPELSPRRGGCRLSLQLRLGMLHKRE